MTTDAAGRWDTVPADKRDRIDPRGLWRDLRVVPAAGAPRPALFLDRDGTIIEEVDYIARPEDVRAIAAALELIAGANARGIPVVVVTNQGGIGRGLLDWADYVAVDDAMATALAAAGAFVDAVYANPHAPPAQGAPPPFGRKPDPGMLTAAAEDLGLDLTRSWIAGDHVTDLAAGRNAGLALGWLVPSGHGARHGPDAAALAVVGFEVVVGRDLGALTARLDALSTSDAETLYEDPTRQEP